MRTTGLSLIAVAQLMVAIGFARAADNRPVVATSAGMVRGISDGDSEAFKGIPFAAAPVGALRWQPPVDPPTWPGVRDAAQFSCACPQPERGPRAHRLECYEPQSPDAHVVGREDCLYLNIWRPKRPEAGPRPVMVFIHGGSHIHGSAGYEVNGVAVYDGARLSQNGDVVVVSINYRLGALGFLAHRKLSEESRYGGSGDYGYMDQIHALKWVQRNIAAFGGDPGNVTVFGQSAGGWSVAVLLTSPEARNLFHRAIIHSGGTMAMSLTAAERGGASLTRNTHCDGPDSDALTCLRNKPASAIVAALPGEGPSGTGLYGPVVDNHVLEDFPLAVMQRGEHQHMPLLIGTTEEEMSLMGFAASRTIHSEADYVAAVNAAAGAAAPTLLALYPAADYPSPRQAYNAIGADNVFVCPARQIARAIGRSQTKFVGRFHYTHTLSGGPFVWYGSSHGFELFFVFGNFAAAAFNPTDAERALARIFQDAWATFARTGMPGSESSWPRYQVERDNYLTFNDDVTPGAALRTRQCDFWDASFRALP